MKHKPKFVTFTGIDDRVDLRRVCELSDSYPIEWGVLVGGKIGSNRYPSMDRIDVARELVLSLSMHLCKEFASKALNGIVPIDLTGFSRVQINAINYDLEALSNFHNMTGCHVLMQCRTNEFPDLPEGVYALHDKSGGKGISPTSRPLQRDPTRIVGYAGGIGPDNVDEVLSQINAENYFVDMESNIRTDDWLDLDKCESVCQKIWGTR